MNARIFMDYCHAIDVPSLLSRATLSDDDTGTALRLHLLCERMVEAWICSCCDCVELFGSDKNKVRIDCDAKIAMAGNLGIPSELVKTLKTFNSLRNDLAHNPSIEEIPNSRIQSMKDSLNSYLVKFPDEEPLEKTRVGFIGDDEKTISEHSFNSNETPNRLKLCLIFAKIMKLLFKQVAANHKGNWDNQFSQFEYNVTMNATKPA
ncbi:hypothetical protein ACT555_004626 [Citrobacter amalonaticus]|uniref:hypothetical protein n=1 Tax=Citrobacter amalonaticus TaxID=35703 RepID=UPI001F1CD654|nr:hypothetical protein [Citrobacter amalonaticus]